MILLCTHAAHPSNVKGRRICWLDGYLAAAAATTTTTNKNGLAHFVPRFAFYHHFYFECAFYLVMKRKLLLSSSQLSFVLLFLVALFFFLLCLPLDEDVKVVATTFFTKWNESYTMSPSHLAKQLKTICRYSHKEKREKKTIIIILRWPYNLNNENHMTAVVWLLSADCSVDHFTYIYVCCMHHSYTHTYNTPIRNVSFYDRLCAYYMNIWVPEIARWRCTLVLALIIDHTKGSELSFNNNNNNGSSDTSTKLAQETATDTHQHKEHF